MANQPFYADLELSQVNGTLCPRRSAYTPTLNSRLASLWRHISKSRTEFETKPDTGFMGKGLTRQLNRAWNYGFKGLLCSLLFLLIFPVILYPMQRRRHLPGAVRSCLGSCLRPDLPGLHNPSLGCG